MKRLNIYSLQQIPNTRAPKRSGEEEEDEEAEDEEDEDDGRGRERKRESVTRCDHGANHLNALHAIAYVVS